MYTTKIACNSHKQKLYLVNLSLPVCFFFFTQTSSLPRAWNPHSHDNKALQIDDVNGKGSTSSSPPPTPTLSEPMEKRSRSDTREIYADGDEDTQPGSPDNNKLGVIQHGQSINSIISMEDDDFASDDEKVKLSHSSIFTKFPW